MQLDSSDHPESQLEIEFDGAVVLCGDMKPRYQSVTTLILCDVPDKTGGVTIAVISRMCADAADLGIAVYRQPFTSHCDQLPVL